MVKAKLKKAAGKKAAASPLAKAGKKAYTKGQLITGEPFSTVQDLKKILTTPARRIDFYRCLTEKLMTYALGRGVEYYDTESVDQIVARLEKSGGHMSALIGGIVDSPAFQKRREAPSAE